jgi:hypothetical protein
MRKPHGKTATGPWPVLAIWYVLINFLQQIEEVTSEQRDGHWVARVDIEPAAISFDPVKGGAVAPQMVADLTQTRIAQTLRQQEARHGQVARRTAQSVHNCWHRSRNKRSFPTGPEQCTHSPNLF